MTVERSQEERKALASFATAKQTNMIKSVVYPGPQSMCELASDMWVAVRHSLQTVSIVLQKRDVRDSFAGQFAFG